MTVAAQHPPGQVKETLLRALDGVDGVLTTPNPIALVTGYEQNVIQYLISYWIHDFGTKNIIQDVVYSRFWYALGRADMGAPFSILDFNVRSPEEDERIAIARQERVAQFLRTLPMLAEWDNGQVDLLAAVCLLKSYTNGELLVRQGDEGDSLFIIYTGQSGVFVEHDENRVRVATRGTGEFFGEMSLLTGNPPAQRLSLLKVRWRLSSLISQVLSRYSQPILRF